MENNEMDMRINDIMSSITYYRLLSSLAITEGKLSENTIQAEKSDANVFQKGLTRTVNAMKASNTEHFNKEKAKTLATIEEFKRNCVEETIYSYGESQETLTNELIDFLREDKDDYLKYQIALMCILDNRYPHAYEDETFIKVSTLLFSDGRKLGEIQKKLKKNLKAILGDNSAEITKTVLISLGLAAVATTLVGGLYMVGKSSSSANFRQVLANLAHKAPQMFGPGLAKATGAVALFALTGGLIAVPYGIKDMVQENREFKKAMRELKPTDLASSLALKLTLVELTSEKASRLDIKEYREAVLSDADYIRSDCEYLYIIEKYDEKESKTKAEICNRAVLRLAEI